MLTDSEILEAIDSKREVSFRDSSGVYRGRIIAWKVLSSTRNIWATVELLDEPLKGHFRLVNQNNLAFGLSSIDRQRYPSECPRCKSPAYVGLNAIECSRRGSCK